MLGMLDSDIGSAIL